MRLRLGRTPRLPRVIADGIREPIKAGLVVWCEAPDHAHVSRLHLYRGTVLHIGTDDGQPYLYVTVEGHKRRHGAYRAIPEQYWDGNKRATIDEEGARRYFATHLGPNLTAAPYGEALTLSRLRGPVAKCVGV